MIPALVRLLQDTNPDVCVAATGTLQNLSRDPVVRTMIVDANAVEYLTDLLFASDVSCQVKTYT